MEDTNKPKEEEKLSLIIYEGEMKRKDLVELFDELFMISSSNEKTEYDKTDLDYFLKNNIFTISARSQVDG